MRKVLIALALALTLGLSAFLPWAFAAVTVTNVGNANYQILNTDVRLVPTVALTANRTWTLPYAGTMGNNFIDIIDPQGNVGGSNSCIVVAPQSGDTINGSTGSFTTCSIFGKFTLTPATGTNWITSFNGSQFVTTNIPLASAKQITTNSSITLGSVSLPPGDWDCRATAVHALSNTTTATRLSASLVTTDGVLGTEGTDGTTAIIPVSAGSPRQRPQARPSAVLSRWYHYHLPRRWCNIRHFPTLGLRLALLPRSRLMLWLALLVPVAYIPGITGASMATGWAVMSAGLPVATWKGGGKLSSPIPIFLGLLFCLYAFVSTQWVNNPETAVSTLWQYALMGLAFWAGTQREDLRPLAIGLAIGFGISSLLTLAQALGFDAIIEYIPCRPSGLMFQPHHPRRGLCTYYPSLPRISALLAGPGSCSWLGPFPISRCLSRAGRWIDPSIL